MTPQQRIRLARRHAGLSQAALAHAVGVQRSAVSHWEATPGTWRLEYDEWEFCHILAGVSVITEEGGEARTVKAGDSCVLRPGF